MYLTSLTVLLLALTILSMIAPSIWQGIAILVVVIMMALDAHNQPPVD